MNNTIGIAVVGLGRISATHIDGIQKLGERARLAGVVDIREEIAREAANRYGVPHYVSIEEALKDERINALVVCLPHDQHEEAVKKAAAAGRHVLVEKAMARNYDEGLRMTEAAKQGGVKLMVAQSRRYISHLREAKSMVRQIGPLTGILYTFAANFQAATAPAWWKSKEATGGLVYPMMGSHSIDFMLWLNEGDKPAAVFAKGSDTNSDFEGDDQAVIVLTFESGLVATSYLTLNSRVPRHEGLLTGQAGSIYFTHDGDHGGGLVGVPNTDLYLNGKLIKTGSSEPHAFAVQMGEFVDAIVEDREPESSGMKILTQTRILDAAQQSSREGREISLL